MIGRRKDLDEGQLHLPGEYGKFKNHWLCCTPNGIPGNLNNHNITEHEDGTITVYPSIKTSQENSPNSSYHGFLRRGTWRRIERNE